ncbi:LysM peptidoglycan-binding domain-containing protein [Rubrivivax albus]|uniref:LysM domain-containing protein n=1 Tax=Rubrivivax albus TaxID=2499835 RepID=A0A437JW55_9BURK|nr:LysM domain-containing protein [Rubrivivax albus]RVT51615.1 LysM domain-containing protein [Rubrivivax albus]
MSLPLRLTARRRVGPVLLACAALAWHAGPAVAAGPNLPVTPEWRATAQQVAQAGVPLSELSPNAPDSYTVQRGDTLWDISKLFLTTPWRWPELWGMNLDQIRNPHLIFPGQVLYLVKQDGRATLRLARPGDGMPDNTVKLGPRVRSQVLDNGAIAAIPLHLIGPFLNDAVVFETNELASAPRIVATQEGRVLVSRGETAYVRGDLGGARDFRLFREAKPLLDPQTREILGYEARYVGTAALERPAEDRVGAGGRPEIVPATFRINDLRLEAGIGDRLHPVPQSDLIAYAPHAPAQPVDGRVVSIYGDGLNAGQNQIVSINRGARDGIERGHVLALWRAGAPAVDRTGTDGRPQVIRLPDERHGLLFVFRTFERVSYALIVSVQEPVRAGDRFTQP